MRTLTIIALAAVLATPAFAQMRPQDTKVNSTNRAGAEPIEGDAVFQAFGGKDGIQRIIDDFVPRIVADPRIGAHFQGVDLKNLNKQLVDQICYLTGGPCQYAGKTMTESHAGMGVTNADFNALAEDLQISMNKEKVPFNAQNRLLAKLAPMQRVITGQ